ncbi:MAG: DNA polymerase I [Spirochaetales bacterium]|nr:DNA polymerase I [Spirochaetales bacterium]
MPDKKRRVFIVDGYGQIYRSYFAFLTNPLKDKDGNNVSAVFGFFNTVMMLVRQYRPEYIVVAMDSRGKTFRHEMYDQYKANRDKTPDDLHAQVPIIDDFLDRMNIPHYERQGMEADDIIATIARKASREGMETVMVTGDKDLLQLVRDDVFALRPPRKGEKEYRLCGKPEVEEIFGVRPDQIVDYLTILGDSSDNVPGISGIGEKGAVKLLSEYQSLDNIYSSIGSMSKGIQAKLEAARDHIELSRNLVTLRDDVFDDSEIDFESFGVSRIDWRTGVGLFRGIGSENLAKAAERLIPAEDFTLMPENATEAPEREVPGNAKATTRDISAMELKDILSKTMDRDLLAIDVELSGDDEMKADLASISISTTASEVLRLQPTEEVRDVLEGWMGRLRIVGQNLKMKKKALRRWGLVDFTSYADTMLASWLLNTSQTKFEAEDPSESLGNLERLERELSEKGLQDIFHNLEMPLSDILCSMEYEGITLDTGRIEDFGRDLEKEVLSIQHDIYTLCGYEFNLNSPKQLQEVLFVERNLPTGKKTKSGFSTDSDVLESLADNTEDPVPELLLRYRLLSKLLSTYVNALPTLINPETGRVHTTFLQTGTATGRLSSKNPNLQNIPIRTEEGRRIRDAFVPKAGCRLMSADYSQIELVVLSHISGDINLRNAFLHGEDVHRETAALIFDEFPEMVTPEHRRAAKTINFGIMYGMSAFRLARDLKIPRKDAQRFIDSYFEQYRGVREFIEQTKEQARRDGFVKTAQGHIRYIPEMRSSNKTELAAAERAAVNTIIQGTAAEIMKKAMISMDQAIKDAGLKAKMLLQVHDEVIFEVPEDECSALEDLVRRCMEGAAKLSVPLKVGIEFGSSWGEMH